MNKASTTAENTDNSSIDLVDAEIELVPRNCRLSEYKTENELSYVKEDTDVVCFASPDSSYFVIKEALASAVTEVFVSIYDLTATYMEDLLVDLAARNIDTKLMIDYDRRAGESDMVDRISKLRGVQVVVAPSCGNNMTDASVRLFPSCHEKVIVIDKKSVLVESCNWTENSVPFNESEPNKDGTSSGNFVTGNREWGVWVKNKKIAMSFYDSLIEDFNRGTRYTEEISLQTEEEELYEIISVKTPSALFPSASFSVSRLLPLLTPDNYFQNVKEIISKAKHSIYIQQQYVKPNSSHVSELLDLIKILRARNKTLDVKIIVSPKVFGPKQKKQLESDISEIAARFGLKLGKNIRFLNLDYFIHCHNKGILVDDEISIIASQNWSETGIGEKGANREAGIVIYNKKLNSYFSRIFKSDWKSGTKSITVSKVVKRDILPNTIELYGPSLQFAKINPGDHLQV